MHTPPIQRQDMVARVVDKKSGSRKPGIGSGKRKVCGRNMKVGGCAGQIRAKGEKLVFQGREVTCKCV